LSHTLSLLLLLSSSSSSSPLAFIVGTALRLAEESAKKEANMHLKGQALVKGSTTLCLATCGVVHLLLLIFGQFLEGGGNESPFKNCPKTTRKPRRIKSTASHDGNISSVDCCVARKMSTRAVVAKN
jgi:hypothetical protein